MKLRFRLGRKIIGSNLATTPTGTSLDVQYTGIVQPGKYYRVGFTVNDADAWVKTIVGISYTGLQNVEVMLKGKIGERIEFVRQCISGDTVRLKCGTVGGVTATVSDVTVYELDWNDPLGDNPKGWEDLKIEYVTDEEFIGLNRKICSELEFYGEGFEQLYSLFKEPVFQDEALAVKIEYSKDGNALWKELLTGEINLRDPKLVVDVQNCRIRCVIKDNSVLGALQRNKDQAVFHFADDLIVIPDYQVSDSGGTGNFRRYWRFYDVLSALVWNATNGNAKFESAFFALDPSCQWSGIMYGAYTSSSGVSSTLFSFSFNEFFTELNKIFNLAIWMEKDGEGVVTVKIEPKEDFYASLSNVLTIDSPANVRISPNPSYFVRKLNVGYHTVYNSKVTSDVAYVPNCRNGGIELDYVSRWIGDSESIHQYFLGTYTPNLFLLIEGEDDTSDPAPLNSSPTTTGGLYNSSYTEDEIALRRIQYYNCVDWTNNNSGVQIDSNPAFTESKYIEFSHFISFSDYFAIFSQTNPGVNVHTSNPRVIGVISKLLLDLKTMEAKFWLYSE